MGDLRLIVFDCDGTLVDSQHLIFAAIGQAFDSLAQPVPGLDDVRRIVGLSLVEAMSVLVPQGGDDLHLELAEAYKSAFKDLRSERKVQAPLFPLVAETLEALGEAGFLLGIATGKSRVGLAFTLEEHALAPYFTTLQTADDAPGKPHPGMLEQAMNEVGATPQSTVLVGDTVYDIEMAKNAGVAGVGVDWGYHPPEELKQAGANAIIASFGELPSIVETLTGPVAA